MQKVAGYSLVGKRDLEPGASQFKKLNALVRAWINSKGSLSVEGDTTYVTYEDGRKAEYSAVPTDSPSAQLYEHTLVEPTESGLFQTRVVLATDKDQVGVYVELAAAGDAYLLGPTQLDVRCPQIVRTIIDSSTEWYVGETPVSSKPAVFAGKDDGETLVDVIWHPTRNLPVVVVSRHEGGPLSPNFVQNLAGDLSGLALVADADEQTSWVVSERKGKDWACYNGAVRIYWPMRANLSNPYAHPLWTRYRLLSGVTEPKDASYRIRRQLRRQIIGLSAYSVSEPKFLGQIRQEARRRDIDEQKARATKNADWEKIAEDIDKDNIQLRAKLEEASTRVSTLESEVSNLQIALRWRNGEGNDEEIQPDLEVPPVTVTEAVQQARERFQDVLVFGNSVGDGIQSLAPDAGPPEKIFKYLSHLAALAETRKKGSLGKAAVHWLRDRGVSASVESETVRKAGGRRWHDGKEVRAFDLHLKPSDAVSPDRCVRIYFAHDEENGCVRIGWVGRHP